MDAKYIKFSTGSTLLTGLVSYWKLNEASGNATDSKGSNTLTASNIAYGNAGKIGNCFRFNGTSSKLTSGSSLGISTAWSLSIPFKTSVGGNLLNDIDFGGSKGIGIWCDNASGGIEVYANGATIDFYLDYTTNTNNVWHELILTYDGSNIRSYLDGTADQYRAFSTFSATGSAFNLGWDGSTFFTGDLDEIAVWSKALTSTEVTERWNSGNLKTYPFS